MDGQTDTFVAILPGDRVHAVCEELAFDGSSGIVCEGSVVRSGGCEQLGTTAGARFCALCTCSEPTVALDADTITVRIAIHKTAVR